MSLRGSTAARLWRLLAVPAVLGMSALLSACDPCAGVLGCMTPATIRASGRMVAYPSGRGVSGVQVSVLVGTDRADAVSDAESFWSAELLATNSTGGAVTATVRVAESADRGYAVDSVMLPVVRRRGDGANLGRWYVRPQLRFIGELRPQVGLNVDGATVTVERVNGVGLDSTTLFSATTEGRQFYVEAPARGVGPMELRLTVRAPGLSRAYVQQGVQVRPMYRDTVPGLQGVYYVGTTLPYVARIERRGPRTPLSGVTAIFRRTGGVPLAVSTVQSVSNAAGLISLQMEPLAQGEVVGDLELRPPAPLPVETVRNVRLATVDDDVLRFAGAYPVGPALPYVLRLYRRGLGSAFGGVTATFRRRSGVATVVDTLRMISTPDGLVSLQLMPTAVGELVGDLELRPPAPLAPRTISGLRLQAILNDSLRQVANVGVGPALPYILRIFRRGLDTPFAGVPVIFRRRSGVQTLVDTLTMQSTADGLVSLQLVPADTGTLVGDLELRPTGLTPTILPGFRLTAVEDDSLRLVGNVGVGPQVRYAFQFYVRNSFATPPLMDVEFVPTSGPLSVSTRERSQPNGVVGVTGAATGVGTVEGDLIMHYASPRAPEVRRGIRLQAVADDSVRFGGYFGVGPSLLYVGAVEDVDSGKPITSGTAEFRRTGGIPVQESVFTWSVTNLGLFRIAPTPLADGDVVGDLTLRLPTPYRDTTFTGIRLSTFATDETRPGPTFRVKKP